MKKAFKFIVLGLSLSIMGGVVAIGIYKYFEKPISFTTLMNSSANENILTNNKLGIEKPVNLEMAAEMSLNAVVHVKTEVLTQRSIDPFYQLFYGVPQQPQLAQASGSGVLISDDGYIVTNNHVIENAENISITLNNNKSYKAAVIGTDPNTDLALLKIDQTNLPFIQYGNSNDVHIGEWVLAVGNPYNLTSTVTAGIISAKGRDINILRNNPYTGMSAIESFIQTDAAVNPGNSGGALVNSSGELIGINSAIQSNTGSYTGYSFAIPVNIVKKVVKDLKEFGTVQRAFIGVSIRDFDEELANKLSMDDLNGVYVNGTTENGSAKKAGVKSGDIIKKIGIKSVKNVAELQEQISQFRPGDEVELTVVRDGYEIKLPVILKNSQGNENIVSEETNSILKQLGAKFSEVAPKELNHLNLTGGVKVEELYNGKLRSVGVREGFIITKVNGKKINNVDELTSTIEKLKDGILMEGIYENGRREFYGFGV
ncbi:MAG: deoxyribonuclease HsdR [Flavobacteriales bacterium CG_4_10_14_0_2_um_filter_32_8]|nr:MAG: deoxyribonuclease HsdR [Flavobacteriales bacterium CG_4_10_14_0_2_um_filter_32_8]